MLLRVLFLAVAVQGFAQVPNKSFPPTSSHRREVESVLRTGKDGPRVSFNEDAITEASNWYEKGDRKILPALLAASIHSDAASSEALGSFLGEQLLKHPNDILQASSSLPIKVQQEAANLAVSADGGGWAPQEMKQIRAILTKYSKLKGSRLSATAKLWLSQLDLFESSNRE